jgi:hypothetical protein
MPINLNSKEAFISACQSAEKPVAFLIGSAMSKDPLGGVPGVNEILQLVEDEVGIRRRSSVRLLKEAIGQTTGAEAYQAALSFLQGHFTQSAVNDVVRKAVLRARRPGSPQDFNLDGDYSDWILPKGTKALAALLSGRVDQFPGPVLTTNFDPLASLAFRAKGGMPRIKALDTDSRMVGDLDPDQRGCEFVHLHGYWRDRQSLHTPTQLSGPRPRLKSYLKRLLTERTLVVLGYGGWDDVITEALRESADEAPGHISVLWCFHEQDPDIVEVRYSQLIDGVQDAITAGTFLTYGGIDCHTILSDLLRDIDPSDRVIVSSSASPIAGWNRIDKEYLASLPKLQDSEIVRYFDGASPTWRHAVSEGIPKRRVVDALSERIDQIAIKRTVCTLQLIRAAGGEGKSTVLLQTAAVLANKPGWAILWRSHSAMPLPAERVIGLHEAKQWLIVVDEAENAVDDLVECARRLHELGRVNVHFLLSARDTDWIHAQGDFASWSLWLTKLDDIVLRGIDVADAGSIVDAWTAHGKDGLRRLEITIDRTERIRLLIEATKGENATLGEGSFYGGLLHARFDEAGLRAHIHACLVRLKEHVIRGSDYNLYDALCFIAACHSPGIGGIDMNLLADLLGVPGHWVHKLVLRPLGEEALGAHSATMARIRHRKVADAIIIEAENSLGTDIAEVWRLLARENATSWKSGRLSKWSHMGISHAGPNLQTSLPNKLTLQKRKAIAIAAARSSYLELRDRVDIIVDLGKTYRIASMLDDALSLFLETWASIRTKDDYYVTARGFWHEWGVCAGMKGANKNFIAINIWLAGIALSDQLENALLGQKHATHLCSGISLAFGRLATAMDDGDSLRLAQRAATYLGRQTNPDPQGLSYLDRHDSELDDFNTNYPSDIDEALIWLRNGVRTAHGQIREDAYASLADPAVLSFNYFAQRLASQFA